MSKHHLNAIFWDNDGVLVDTETLYLKATKQALKAIAVDLTDQLFIEHFLEKHTGLDSLLSGFEPEVISYIRIQRNQIYSSLLGNEEVLIPGVKDVLYTLAAKYKMGIVTSCKPDHFQLMHSHTGILNNFDFILTAKDYQNEKPHPAPYLKALEISGFSPENCLVIEDSLRGLKSAKAAGIKCCLVKSLFSNLKPFGGYDYCLNSLLELPKLINENFLS
jgi:HAD superfamily hydrolase (TIGR01509 family)